MLKENNSKLQKELLTTFQDELQNEFKKINKQLLQGIDEQVKISYIFYDSLCTRND